MTDAPRLLDRELHSLLAKCFTPQQLLTMDPVQRTEIRRFFFAGARAFSGLLMENASRGDEVSDGDMALMEALQAELDQFGADVAAGRA